MVYCARWNKNSRPWRELYNELEVPQHQVATFRIIVVAQRSDATPAKCEVAVVSVGVANGLWPKIKGCGRPRGLGPVAPQFSAFRGWVNACRPQLVVVIDYLGKTVVLILIEPRGPGRKCTCQDY